MTQYVIKDYRAVYILKPLSGFVVIEIVNEIDTVLITTKHT